MRSSEIQRPHAAITVVMALMGAASVLNVGVAAENEEAADGFVQRVLSQTTQSGIAIRATRHLEAGTVSGKHHGWMDVETTVARSGAFNWQVLGEGGSENTREKVFRALLAAESETWRGGAGDGAALSAANYEFVPESSTSGGNVRIQLRPKRADSRLIDGVLIVSPDGYPLLVQGRLAKPPSFWVKSVTIVKRYARVGGISLPVLIESLADVRMFGRSAFSMRYRYTEVNGRSVVHTSTGAVPGPSAELLALHAQLAPEQ